MSAPVGSAPAPAPVPLPVALPTPPPSAPPPNFNLFASVVCAIFGSVLSFYFMFQYVINGRFHQLAYYRRHLLVRAVTYCRVIHAKMSHYHDASEEIDPEVFASKRPRLFLFLAAVHLTVGTLFHFIFTFTLLLFDSQIIYKSFYREGIDLPIDQLMVTISLEFALALRAPWIQKILAPFVQFIIYLGRITLDLGKFGVQCNGMKLPGMLFLNVLVVGVVIIIVESNYVLFEQVSLKKTLDVALKAAFKTKFRQQEEFKRSPLKYYLFLVGASFLNLLVNGKMFLNALKLAMLSVNFNPFFSLAWRNSDLTKHFYCDKASNIDSYAAYWACFLAVIAVPAFLYSTVKFIVPVSIFEGGMQKHEVEAGKDMFARLWTRFCGASVKQGLPQIRRDERTSFATEEEKRRKEEKDDANAALLGMVYSLASPDLWYLKATKEIINFFYGLFKDDKDWNHISIPLGTSVNAPVFQIASGSSKDAAVMRGWERHYPLRLPSLFNFICRVGESQRLEKAHNNRDARSSSAFHPRFIEKSTEMVDKKRVPIKLCVMNNKGGMRHKAKIIDKDLQISSLRKQSNPPLSNLLNSDWIIPVPGNNGSQPVPPWVAPTAEEAEITIDLGTARIVTGYGLSKMTSPEDKLSEPVSWQVWGVPIIKCKPLKNDTFGGEHPLDVTSATVKEEMVTEDRPKWVLLHEFSEGQKGHFVDITHKVDLSKPFQPYVPLGTLFPSPDPASANDTDLGNDDDPNDPPRRVWCRNDPSENNPLARWELFTFDTPTTCSQIRIKFLNSRGGFDKHHPVSINHFHVYLDKEIEATSWLTTQLFHYLRVVSQTYFLFITACLGLWYKSWTIAFEITRPTNKKHHNEVANISEQFEVDAQILRPTAFNRTDDAEVAIEEDLVSMADTYATLEKNQSTAMTSKERDEKVSRSSKSP